MSTNTDKIGKVAEIKVQLALLSHYDNVLVPVLKSRYDLLFESNGTFYRVQVKNGRLRRGCIKFNTCSYCAFTKVNKSYTSKEIDYYGVYCKEQDSVYLIPIFVASNKRNCSLRLEAPLNNSPNIRYAIDYLLP